MARKGKGRQKQGPPVTFRPGPELEQLVTGVATARELKPNEAFKHLAALAAVGLDVRYYDLVAELATRMSGLNPFVRAVLQLNDALLAAVRVDPSYAFDPTRTVFVIDTVRVRVAAAGGSLRVEVVRTLFARLGIQTPDVAGGETAADETAFHSTGFGRQREAVKVRIEGG